MSSEKYTIGQLARRSGISVRRIRFYSDRGLLPPTARSDAGYRVYSLIDLARLELIRTLREAGVSLEAIRKMLSRKMALSEVLQMRLGTLEAEISSRRRVSAVLRATLRMPHPTECDLRRLWATATFSRARLLATIQDFVDKVIDGFEVGDAWKTNMMDCTIPELPEEPTPEQIDAWAEIIRMLTDERSLAESRVEMESVWNDQIQCTDFVDVSNEIRKKVEDAIRSGIEPSSAAALAIGREWIDRLANVMKREPNEAFVAWARRKNARSLRFQRLLAVLRSGDNRASVSKEWLWLNEALERRIEIGA
jgi:DNA-binding transcriptional MerR regulator